MGIINLLDSQVANLIAAGEVVERPASAVKELLENSIDAGANKITLEIKNGGVSLIRVTDNGCGMTKDDALVCIKRHATSKIKDEKDLDGIATLGFRGEALAAISSVSKMRIMTRTKDSPMGIVVECTAGNVTSVEDAGCPEGTTIIVEELFANVPARKKFLKRDISETSAVVAVAEKIALSRPDIAFKLITDGNIKFATVGDSNLANVIYAVLGRDFAKKLAKVHDMTEGIEVEGFIGTPENCRGNRNYENFFINGRYVKCQTAAAALEQAFSSYIPSDRFPSCVINLNINPAFVDVNVHPQKMEVKFSNEKIVFNAVYCAVRNTLMNRINRPQLDIKEPVRMSGDSFKLYNDIISAKTDSDEEALKIANDKDLLNSKYEQITLNSANRDSILANEPPISIPNLQHKTFTENTPLDFHKKETVESIPTTEVLKKSDLNTEAEGFKKGKPNNIPFDFQNENTNGVKDDTSDITRGNEDSAQTLPWFRIAGVIFNTYIFVELEDKMLIIDKHAAHERIIFENMRENMKKKDSVSQLLLLPLQIDLTNDEISAAEEYREELLKIGFDFTQGEKEKSIAILQYPSGLNAGQATDMFSEIVLRLSDGTGNIDTSRELLYEKALYQASCKAAVKGGREDLPENIRWIAEQVLTQPKIRYCPHGRPVAFEMTKNQFEKRFERI